MLLSLLWANLSLTALWQNFSRILGIEWKLMSQLLRLKQISMIFYQVTIDVVSPEAGVLQEWQFVAMEGDTVEPGTKIAVISRSGEGVTHVAPSEKPSEKAHSQPSSHAAKIEEKEMPVVETTITTEKPKAHSPKPLKQSAAEPQLLPKERER